MDERCDGQGNLKSVSVESSRYVESDAKLIERVLGREVGGKDNLLVMNDKAHHAHRLRHSLLAHKELWQRCRLSCAKLPVRLPFFGVFR